MAYDVVVVGAGHNGLIAAAMLARTGLRTLVLERRDRVGGCAATKELAAGFRVPALAHRMSIDRTVLGELELDRHGLQRLRPSAHTCAPTLEGRALTLWADPGRACRDIAAFSPADAARYPAFLQSVDRISTVVRALLDAPPPDLDGSGASGLMNLLRLGRRFRALGRQDGHRLLRWLPMPIADLASEWFESEPLRALVAADGVLGSMLGPRSAGSSAVMLLLASGEGRPIAPGWIPRGGVGAFAQALGSVARETGVEIRTNAPVSQILVGDGGATGVVLESGEEIDAARIVSALDPRRTFLNLLDPIHLAPDFLHRVQNIRMRGTLAKVNFALSGAPAFTGLSMLEAPERAAALSGCVRLAPSTDVIERAFDAAKYGGFADEPWIELAIPSFLDDTLAPPGQHVASAYVQFVPNTFRNADWTDERERVGDVTVRTIARYAPGFENLVVAREVMMPLDFERQVGLTGGHIFHGELALDQLAVARPVLGWSQYRTPIRNLYLCGAGTHPGTGLDGRSGLLAAKAMLRDR